MLTQQQINYNMSIDNQYKQQKVMAKQKTSVQVENETVKETKEFGQSKFCKCSTCGENKFTRADVYIKRIETFGSEENLLKNYKCRNCRKG